MPGVTTVKLEMRETCKKELVGEKNGNAKAYKKFYLGLPFGSVVKNLPATAGDMDWIPGMEDFTCCWAAESMSHNY